MHLGSFKGQDLQGGDSEDGPLLPLERFRRVPIDLFAAILMVQIKDDKYLTFFLYCSKWDSIICEHIHFLYACSCLSGIEQPRHLPVQVSWSNQNSFPKNPPWRLSDTDKQVYQRIFFKNRKLKLIISPKCCEENLIMSYSENTASQSNTITLGKRIKDRKLSPVILLTLHISSIVCKTCSLVCN